MADHDAAEPELKFDEAALNCAACAQSPASRWQDIEGFVLIALWRKFTSSPTISPRPLKSFKKAIMTKLLPCAKLLPSSPRCLGP